MPQTLNVQGRIVWGHPAKLNPKKDARSKQTILKDGQPVMQCAFGLAIEKNYFFSQVLPMLQNEARVSFPNGTPANFSWKYKDGDGVDDKGQPFNKREGYAGHCILTISTTGFAPQIYKQEGASYRQMSAEEIKCGDFVAVNITVKYNGASSPNTPGLYVNPNGVVHLAYMPEIVSSGQDPDEMFAGLQVQLPPGASATPMMGHAPLPAAMQPAPAQPYGAPPAQPYTPAPAAYAQPAQPYSPPHAAPLPAPAHDFVNNAVNAQPYGMPPAAPAYPNQPPAQPQYAAAPAQPYPGIPAGR